MLSLGICGCESSNNTNDSRFQKTGNKYFINDLKWTEYVDNKTNNLYLCNNGLYSAGLSPLYDENGKIAKYKED
ncbi:MAG: DUF6440 family protein [Tissierellia bacterium]|nr:DUF6440 family protein [Tissierellia bacterium]